MRRVNQRHPRGRSSDLVGIQAPVHLDLTNSRSSDLFLRFWAVGVVYLEDPMRNSTGQLFEHHPV